MDWTLSVLSNYFLAEKKTSKESNFIQTEATNTYCPASTNINIAKVSTFKRRLRTHKDRPAKLDTFNKNGHYRRLKTSKQSNLIQK